MIQIRKAKEKDASLLAAAERKIAERPGRLASAPMELKDNAFKKKISFLKDNENGLYIIAEDNNNIIAHAFVERLKLKSTSHVVSFTIAVHEGHQGKGTGKALMNHLINWSKNNVSIEKIELHVRSSNSIAINLYKAMGFVEEGRKTKQLKIAPDKYLDDIYMALWVK